MDSIKINKQKTKMIAHRGLSGIERENTNAAFVAAGNRSYYGIETDLHRTADGHFVVCHDNDLERVAGVKISVEESTLAELRDVILFDKDGTKSRADLRVSTLKEYISICKKYGKQSVLELKSSFTDEEIQKIIEIITELDYLSRVTFISFEYENLLKVRRVSPGQSCQFLIPRRDEAFFDMLVRDKIDIDLPWSALTPELVSLFHGAGMIINCWTVDNPEDAERLASWGVDFITTNILE